MGKTAEIQLNGNTFTIHRFNIGEMERVTEAFQAGPEYMRPYILLRIAMERAEPKPTENVSEIEVTPKELSEINETIAKLAGLQEPDANPPVPAG